MTHDGRRLSIAGAATSQDNHTPILLEEVMATFTSRTIASTRYEWAVPAAEPWGAAYEEIGKALSVAWVKYRGLHGLPEDAPMPGDFARFHVGDSEIVIAFTTEEAQS